MNFIKNYFNKIIAKQLSKPGGFLANKVGNKMNETNRFIYDFTIDNLQLADNESILEIGFGNGKFFDKLFATANNLSIAGLEFSPEMVKAAIKNNQAALASGKLVLQSGSSDKIPFADKSFDKVFCINVIYFWEQPAQHLKEIHRVLKPGGKFYTAIRSKETLERMPFAKYGFTIYTEDAWVNMLQANQLHFVQTKKTENEPDAVIDGEAYKVQSLCIIAEKKR